MKLIGLIILIAIMGLIFFGPQKDKIQFAGIPDNIKEQIPKSLGSVLGDSTKRIEKEAVKYYPEQLIKSTLQHASKQISSDAQDLVSGVSRGIVIHQLINTFKALPAGSQKTVREAICK